MKRSFLFELILIAVYMAVTGLSLAAHSQDGFPTGLAFVFGAVGGSGSWIILTHHWDLWRAPWRGELPQRNRVEIIVVAFFSGASPQVLAEEYPSLHPVWIMALSPLMGMWAYLLLLWIYQSFIEAHS